MSTNKKSRGRPKTADERISVAFRVDADIYDMLQDLCDINNRSQREIVEIMIRRYHNAYRADPKLRINP